jgi:hypothetical protein
MGMQTDVLITQALSATDTFKMQNGNVLGPCRIKAIYGISGVSAGAVILYDGTSTAGKLISTINTPAAVNQGTFYLLLPGEGIKINTGVYADITNVDTVMIIYG